MYNRVQEFASNAAAAQDQRMCPHVFLFSFLLVVIKLADTGYGFDNSLLLLYYNPHKLRKIDLVQYGQK